MAGTFILSLDCEGKWGMADSLTADHHAWLTTIRQRAAYSRLLDLFDEFEIASTFAFVMAMLLSDREQRDRDALFQDHAIADTNWLQAFRAAQRDGNMEGWSMPELLEIVQARDRHEIACHGFSHLPLGEEFVPAAVMRGELEAAKQVADARGLSLDTFIYPRNIVGRPHLLGEAGFHGYREGASAPSGPVGKVLNLLSELNIAEKPQQVSAGHDGIVAIPSGYFFNWRHGARRLVPPALTRQRWSALLDQSARTGGVVHLWLHPHNVISAPGTFEVLRSVLRQVARYRDAGKIEVETQHRFSAKVLATH